MTTPQPTHQTDAARAKRPAPQPKLQDTETAPLSLLNQQATAAPGTLAPQDVLQLQRMVGNRAVSQLLTTATPVAQRAVSLSATWTPPNGGQEATWINAIDAQIPTAEQNAVNSVQNTNGHKTAKQANYIQNPSPTTWGYVVEEQLDAWALNNGWQTQFVLNGARPDYYRVNNNVAVYVDLTTAGQAGIGGNHITDKLQNANFPSPDANVAAADVTHRGLNPRGTAGPVVVLGNATLKQIRVFQQYRQYLRHSHLDYNPALEELINRYGKTLTHQTFTRKWNKKKRKSFVDEFKEMLQKPKTVNFKKHNLRARATLKKPKNIYGF